jgi:hypothetical protein
MVGMGLLRAPRVRDKRRRAGLVPTIKTRLEKLAGETQVDVRSHGRRAAEASHSVAPMHGEAISIRINGEIV